MNVDRRGWGTSAVRGRILAAAAVLMGAACVLLGGGSHSGHAGLGRVAAFPEVAASLSAVSDSVSLQEIDSRQSDAQVRAHSLLSGLPLRFEPNQGQGNLDRADSRARFVARGPGFGLFLGAEGATLTLLSRDRSRQNSAAQVDAVQMKLSGANQAPSLTGLDLLPGKSNYLLGNDPQKWRTGITQYARVRYESVYPGINLVFYGDQGQLEYDFQVAPGADPAQAELEFRGADEVQLQDGALVIRTGQGSVALQAPRVYQVIAGEKRPVDAKFVIRGANRAGFAIGSYDRSRELIIDPILTFSTYFGGSGDEHATSVAVDGTGNIYLAGSTTSADLPTTLGTTLKGTGPNVYIAKINPPLGSPAAKLEYVTYLGGNGQDIPAGIKVDGAGQPYVAGT
ncbi:MAG: SBBP repeat-containing protein, partial [Candidatus Sulfotelmatobacter sp.]